MDNRLNLISQGDAQENQQARDIHHQPPSQVALWPSDVKTMSNILCAPGVEVVDLEAAAEASEEATWGGPGEDTGGEGLTTAPIRRNSFHVFNFSIQVLVKEIRQWMLLLMDDVAIDVVTFFMPSAPISTPMSSLSNISFTFLNFRKRAFGHPVEAVALLWFYLQLLQKFSWRNSK